MNRQHNLHFLPTMWLTMQGTGAKQRPDSSRQPCTDSQQTDINQTTAEPCPAQPAVVPCPQPSCASNQQAHALLQQQHIKPQLSCTRCLCTVQGISTAQVQRTRACSYIQMRGTSSGRPRLILQLRCLGKHLPCCSMQLPMTAASCKASAHT